MHCDYHIVTQIKTNRQNDKYGVDKLASHQDLADITNSAVQASPLHSR